jgi:hypothetical protein
MDGRISLRRCVAIIADSGSPFSAGDRAAGPRDLLAQRIIEIAQRGERDRRRIVEEALAQFESSKR